jgi:ADP-ribose pyrophosphatase YjhB (NUDIX family)
MQKGFDHIGVSVIPFCHDGKGNYLISRRGQACKDECGAWEPVGGGSVEHNESLDDAVRREIAEECGASILAVEPLGFREVFRNIGGRSSHWIAFDYRVQIDPETVSITEPEKCSELRWCTVDTIPQPQHSQFPLFLEKYKDIL